MAKYQNDSLEGLTKTIKQQLMPIPSRNSSDAVSANSHLYAFFLGKHLSSMRLRLLASHSFFIGT